MLPTCHDKGQMCENWERDGRGARERAGWGGGAPGGINGDDLDEKVASRLLFLRCGHLLVPVGLLVARLADLVVRAAIPVV